MAFYEMKNTLTEMVYNVSEKPSGGEENESGLDRVCFSLSSHLAEPLCQAFHYLRYRIVAPLDPTKFENRGSVIEEIAVRGLLSIGSISTPMTTPLPVLSSTVVLGAGHKLLRQIGYFFQKDGYTHVRGSTVEKRFNVRKPSLKIFSGNHCGAGGGLPLNHGGVIDWRYRLDSIVEAIETENADIVVLQEYYDSAFAEALISRLQKSYAHMFFHLGQNLMGSESGVMVLSKAAVHKFSYTPFDNNDWTLNRGFASLEIKSSPEANTPFCRILGTHLHHGNQEMDRQIRKEQVSQIVASIEADIPTLLAGDLNIERDGKEGKTLSAFRHGYLDQTPTCTNRLIAQWDQEEREIWDETIDYISLYENERADAIELTDGHLIYAFDENYNTQKAWSDHHSLAVTAKWVKQFLA